MRILAILSIAGLLFIAPASIWADDVVLQWDANTESNVTGYQLYRAEMTGNQSAPFEKVADISGRETVTYTDTVDDAKNWIWCVTAVNMEGLESGPSNIVQYYDLTVPIPPRNLRK